MPEIESVRPTLEACGQGHLLRYYDELGPSQAAAMLDQLAAIDFHQLTKLIDKYLRPGPALPISSGIQPPEIVPPTPVDEKAAAEYQAASQRGRQLTAEGKVAAFVAAGGQGTRLDYQGPKGCFRATPITKKPLFQLFAEQILAASRRFGRAIPWYVMTSPDNDVDTRAFFRRHNYFGLSGDDVFFLVQGTLPAISFDGKVLLAAKDKVAAGPNGHGGCFQAMRESGALRDMASRGVELISYFQVDNPLVRCIDPLFLGLHDLAGAQMSAKCLPKRDPFEKLGNFCVLDGKVTVIEYSDMPRELAVATTEDGHLRFSAGSIAIHVLSRSFAQRLTEGGKCPLPLHRAEKASAFIDETGALIEPEKPNTIKLEMFIFDAMPPAAKTVILETVRSEEFSPIKNAEGPDSPATSLHDQVRRAAKWLEQAGIKVPRDADGQVAAAIEISPLYASSAEDLAEKVDRRLTIAPGQSLYLGT